MAALATGALRVGRDHIAATVKSLFLAYAVADPPVMILFVTGRTRWAPWPPTEIVAVDVVRALTSADSDERPDESSSGAAPQVIVGCDSHH